VYSSVFPPQALEYVRNVELSYADVPNQISLMEGLYYFSGSYVNTPINGDPVTDPTYVSMVQAFKKQDEKTFRLDLEMLINTIVGNSSEQYKDYNQDGQVDTYYADGYGSLRNGDQAGYLQLIDQQVKLAYDAADATQNIRQQSQNIQACIENMQNWTDQILPLALKLNDMPFDNGMKDSIDELSKLGDALVNGVDQNTNGAIDPVVGECGAGKAYEYGWDLADFLIYTGPDRVPPPAK
jgi:hypothetical protein